MSQSFKPSILWIALGVIVLFFLFNHWMSSEISRPAQTQQMIAPASSAVPANPQQTFTLPQLPAEKEAIQAEVIPDQVKDSSPQEGEKVYEPIYEPPTNDVILVQ